MYTYKQEFLDYLRKVRGFSSRTIETYDFNVNKLHVFLACPQLDCAKRSDIADFICYLHEQGYNPSTINNYISSITTYYNYVCNFIDTSLVNPCSCIKHVKSGFRLPRFLTEEQIQKVFDNMQAFSGFQGSRAAAIIALFYHTGIRCSELQSLSISNVDLRNNTIRVIGKRNKERIIPISNDCRAYLIAWLQYRDYSYDIISYCDNFFISKQGTELTCKQIRYIVKRCLVRIVPGSLAHPHVLRHSFATHLMNKGCNIEYIRALLGHASVITTSIYTHTSIENLQSIYNSIFNRHE